jgi:hypothetical protein
VADRELFSVLFPDKPKTSVAAVSVASAEPATPDPAPVAASATPASDETASVAADAGPATPEPEPAAAVAEAKTPPPASLVPSAVAATTEAVPLSAVAAAPPAESAAPSGSFIIDSHRTAWEVAGERYNHSSTEYIFPNGTKRTGEQIKDWAHIPANTRVILEGEDTEEFEGFLEVGKHGDTAKEVAGTASTSSTTIYFFPDGFIRTGAELSRRRSYHKLLNNPPKETKVLLGYVYGGYVKGRRPPSSIAGVKWNYPSTYYRYPDGRMVNGDDINDKEIPPGTLVFYQR